MIIPSKVRAVVFKFLQELSCVKDLEGAELMHFLLGEPTQWNALDEGYIQCSLSPYTWELGWQLSLAVLRKSYCL